MRELRPLLIQAKHNNKNFEVNYDSLDDTQFVAVNSIANKVLLRAPAGSGKTKSVITAIAAYRYENINDRICAITYTRAARAEMETRLQEMGIFDVEVTTIHVWARNLLVQMSEKYNFKIKILEESHIKMILQELVNEYTLHSKIKNINIDILYTYITGNKLMDVSDAFKKTLNALESRYVEYKRDNNLYDFTDYPLYLYDVMTAYNEEVYDIDALFVDEYQDVDSIQFELFEKVHAKKKFYCGDEWQSIFVFRGADGEVFKKTKGFNELKLKFNYRSYQEIIDYSTTVYLSLRSQVDYRGDCCISDIMFSRPSSINCAKGYGGKVAVINPFGRCSVFNENKVSSVNYVEVFYKMMKLEPMILCRTNKQVREINNSNYYNASTIHQAKGLEYNNVIVIDTNINSIEDLNIAYVALTRARNNLLVINWVQFERLFKNRKELI